MLKCKILKYTRTSRGLALPGPKLVDLPDAEARLLAAKGDVDIIESAPEAAQPKMDRRGRRPQMTRMAEGA